MLNINDLLALLKSSVIADNDDTLVDDEGVSTITDETLMLYLKLGANRVMPEAESLEEIPEELYYALILAAKIAMYPMLAVSKANLVDLNADNNNRLTQSQRFSHYMDLLDKAQSEFKDWRDNESAEANTITPAEVILDNRHFTARNYRLQKTPVVKLKVDRVTTDSIEISWTASKITKFGYYLVYIGEALLIDIHQSGAYIRNKLTNDAKEVYKTSNPRDCHIRIENLEPDTDYHVAVVSVERNQVFGYKEKVVPTLLTEEG